MTTGLEEMEQELRRFPSSVVDEFKQATEALHGQLTESELTNWANQGVEIARQAVRSWEAASEYFRVSPQVVEHLSTAQLLDWGQCGTRLCKESPTLGVAFFKASALTVQHLRPRYIQGWADLGSSLYRGTWKSSALAAKFFDVSGNLLESLAYQEVARFAELLDTLSQKSSDLAADCLLLGQHVLPQIGEDRLPFIKLSHAVAESNWRDVKGCFEHISRVLTNVGQEQRSRFLDLAAMLARGGLSNMSLFLTESSSSLARVESASQGNILDMAEKLLPVSHEAVGAFIRSGPELLLKISQLQLESWFETGMGILEENHDGGLAYFKVESKTAESVLEALSASVELDRVREILRMYCQALAGSDVDIADTQDLLSKNIGWVSEQHATTEGSMVYLPPVANRYGTKQENFSLFKVVSTHQVAHIEFGSFGFTFETPSTQFLDTRASREEAALAMRPADTPAPPEQLQAPLEVTGEIAGEVTGLDTNIQITAPQAAPISAESGYLTDMGRFFNMFDDRKLAQDIFTALEDGRLDFRVQAEYPGVAIAYRQIQMDALADRPRMESLPLQEAMVELLVRISLRKDERVSVPDIFLERAWAIDQIARRLFRVEATVEDTSEGTLRVYEIIADAPNVEIPEEEWTDMDFDDEDASDEDLESLLSQLRSEPSMQDMVDQTVEPEEYDSPPEVDYRGDFKPELNQLLSTLRERAEEGDQAEQHAGMEISKEMLEQMLADNPELELDAEGGEFNSDLAMFVDNLLKEAGAAPPPEPGDGYAPIPHADEEGGVLEAVEPKTFTYDEWDFRAMDYKPRWCMVREKPMAEGDTTFYQETLHSYSSLMNQIRRQFEMLAPEQLKKIKHLPDGDDFDLDAVVEAVIERWTGLQPDDKVYWRRNKIERDVAVVFLLDMSASTAEAIDEAHRLAEDWDAPDDPVEYMVWLRNRRSEGQRRSYKRIIDLEKESIVLLITALETIGDIYGIYGFSGYGRDNVEFYVIKDVEETLSDKIRRRIDKITPLHATRMGPAIRHATSKLAKQDARTKLLFLISDGRPQDRGYSREGVEKEYAVHDTKMALTEARRLGITPFCLTVDKAGHDYLATMCQDMGYEVLTDISSLPSRLPMLYRKLTV